MTATAPLRSATPVIDIYIRVAQYPGLADKIRERMRWELFERSIVDPETFERLVREKAIESQRRERISDPFAHEEAHIWQKRKARVRDFQTDAYFANTLGAALLEQIIDEILSTQPAVSSTAQLTFNPEIAPWELLFRQGEIYEALPDDEREQISHHLEEIKVVLIKRMISDQLPYIGIAKNVFTIADLRYIYERRIGSGKIGGKSAGLMLAWRILQRSESSNGVDISESVSIPESYFLGTEVIYEFRLLNGLDHVMNQKYRSLEEIRDGYPDIVDAHLNGRFPTSIVRRLQTMLEELGSGPLIVRSSSLLEDNFGYAFAGKYNSYFLPNQGSAEENLEELLNAIRLVFASTLNPDAILYRQRHGLIDYDERMAVLLQRVEGEHFGDHFFPTLAGVAFSENPFRWNSKIRREDGFLRLVWGFGTRAVDRVSNDYPRMIALSHPQLRPETTPSAIRQYSQYDMDAIDLERNEFVTLPVDQILTSDYPYLRHIASLDRGDYLQEILSIGTATERERYVLTFNYLTKDRRFVDLMRGSLERLETAYRRPVDMEFTVEIVPDYPHPSYRLNVLQCRPLSQRQEDGGVVVPKDVPEERTLFTGIGLIPDGRVEDIRYLVYIDPHAYYKIGDVTIQQELGRAIGRLNRRLDEESFVLLGPGRWGSVNIDLGVHVTYADIFNTKLLVEIALARGGHLPELSYGTHFFQDLVEAGIHSLALHPDVDGATFNWAFFQDAPNALGDLLPKDQSLAPYLKVIDLAAVEGAGSLRVLMDGKNEEAIGYLEVAQ